MIEPIDRHEPIDSSEPADAIEPTDSTEPIEPIDRTEPFDPIDSTEFSDHNDQRLVSGPSRTSRNAIAMTVQKGDADEHHSARAADANASR
jgi:hypothetical protein